MSQEEFIVENPHNLPLPAPLEVLLPKLFARYDGIQLIKQFGAGQMSQTFGARPFLGEQDELPTVVKLAYAPLIRQEIKVYEAYVRRQLPNVAQIEDEPVFTADGAWGAVRYALVGFGEFNVVSLGQFLQGNGVEKITAVFDRLFTIMEPLWLKGGLKQGIQMRDCYDQVLPVNLRVLPESPPAAAEPRLISASSQPAAHKGDWVRLQNPTVTKVTPASQLMMLSFRGKTRRLHRLYRLDLLGMETLEQHAIGAEIPELTAKVVETRADLLRGYAEAALPGLPLTDERLALTKNGRLLPNPLLKLETILGKLRPMKVTPVHGDFNLENILVDVDTREVHIIDFGNVEKNHVLHDVLRLEAEIVTKLLAPTVHEKGLPADAIESFYRRLYLAHDEPAIAAPKGLEKPFHILRRLRQTAARHLVKANRWEHHHEGLVVYLLGSLRFGNLNRMPSAPLPKQCAFWVTAVLLDILERPPTPPQISKFKRTIQDTSNAKDGSKINESPFKPSTRTSINNVHGPVHTGNGDVNIFENNSKQGKSTPAQKPSAPEEISFIKRVKLIDRLLACPSIAERNKRDVVVNNLPTNIRNNISRQSDARTDISSILQTCLTYPSGLKSLVEVIRYYESGSIPLQQLDKLLLELNIES